MATKNDVKLLREDINDKANKSEMANLMLETDLLKKVTNSIPHRDEIMQKIEIFRNQIDI
jgi:hypothetical protein